MQIEWRKEEKGAEREEFPEVLKCWSRILNGMAAVAVEVMAIGRVDGSMVSSEERSLSASWAMFRDSTLLASWGCLPLSLTG